MGPPSSAQRQSWWQRASSAAADASVAGCSYRTTVSTQCSVEPDEKGVPRRRCERIVNRLRECPGRPVEVIERVEESSTEAHYQDLSKDVHRGIPRHYPDTGEHCHESVLQSDVGELFEDFFKVVAEVDQNYLAEGTTGSVKPQQHCHDSSGRKQPAQVDGTDSLFGRLFRKRVQDGARDPAIPKGKGTTLNNNSSPIQGLFSGLPGGVKRGSCGKRDDATLTSHVTLRSAERICVCFLWWWVWGFC